AGLPHLVVVDEPRHRVADVDEQERVVGEDAPDPVHQPLRLDRRGRRQHPLGVVVTRLPVAGEEARPFAAKGPGERLEGPGGVTLPRATSQGMLRCTGPGRPPRAVRTASWVIAAARDGCGIDADSLVTERKTSTRSVPRALLSCEAPMPTVAPDTWPDRSRTG